MRVLLFVISLLLFVLSTTTAKAHVNESPQHESLFVPLLVCRITIFDTLSSGDGEVASEHDEQTSCIPIIDGEESSDLYLIDIPDDVWTSHEAMLYSGTLILSISNAFIENYRVILSENSVTKVFSSDELPDNRRLFSTSTEGNITVAVVRVSTRDSSPTQSAFQMRLGLFNNGVSMKSQYEKCSFGKLQISIAEGGVLDVNLPNSIREFQNDPNGLVGAVQSYMNTYMNIDASHLGDKVFFCLPPGTGGWAASAGLRHWRAQFNDEWCLSLTATMHEMGHLLGLLHSNQGGRAYMDKTGYMSTGVKSQRTPLRCFNGAKNWQLGWYRDRQRKIQPHRSGPTVLKIAAFTDYDDTPGSIPVLISVAGVYFLQYNRAKHFNSGTGEKRNQLTITENLEDGSESKAGLEVGQRYVVENFKDTGKRLVIHVCESEYSTIDTLTVSIAMDRSFCHLPVYDTTMKPSSSPSTSPVSIPSSAPAHPMPCSIFSDCEQNNEKGDKPTGNCSGFGCETRPTDIPSPETDGTPSYTGSSTKTNDLPDFSRSWEYTSKKIIPDESSCQPIGIWVKFVLLSVTAQLSSFFMYD